MQQFDQIIQANFYHVYNHGVGGRDLFSEPENYRYFMSLYEKYIGAFAETYAWCLMPNHFHLLIQVKEEDVFNADRVSNPVSIKNINPNPNNLNRSLQFSKLFNAYAQAYNKYLKTRGALFDRPFRRKLIDSEYYLKRAIVHIHLNPVLHRFCTQASVYLWSSYAGYLQNDSAGLPAETVLEWFGSKAHFETMHADRAKMAELSENIEV